ncbi:MAG: queuosine precursor transporter [Arachidicoccus sp.]|nr:queuosine precursor transporter [Arachidicoccus sp.]
MINQFLKDRPSKLFLGFAAFFVANALIAECIGGKIFSLEKIFGFHPANLTIFGQSGLSFNLTCGVLLWPLEFVITDIVNEFYGPKAVRRISYTTVILIAYAFLMFFLAIKTPPADFWLSTYVSSGIPNMQNAFSGIFGQGMWIILGSLVAFLFSQIIDVYVFHKIKKRTGNKMIWLRSTGSTLVSQLVDSYIVLIIAFKIGNNWSWAQVLAIGMMNYIYKFIVALILTPVIVYVEKWIENYVGHATAHKMKLQAMGQEQDAFENIPAAG